jgi:hypothetical protein
MLRVKSLRWRRFGSQWRGGQGEGSPSACGEEEGGGSPPRGCPSPEPPGYDHQACPRYGQGRRCGGAQGFGVMQSRYVQVEVPHSVSWAQAYDLMVLGAIWKAYVIDCRIAKKLSGEAGESQ